uniref:Ribosomal protein S7 n=1 Tax=Eukaryota sp. BB2 TaxID=1949062 RepID=A0A1X8VEY7_9EUKA|nr:ribosomal protein S7 [Eukaryota sp. BB2]AQL10473.1 ribosomal protein S7 [Eukaryota sp. BB2]
MIFTKQINQLPIKKRKKKKVFGKDQSKKPVIVFNSPGFYHLYSLRQPQVVYNPQQLKSIFGLIINNKRFKNMRYIPTLIPYYYFHGDAKHILSRKNKNKLPIRAYTKGKVILSYMTKFSRGKEPKNVMMQYKYGFFIPRGPKERVEKSHVTLYRINVLWHLIFKDAIIEKFINCLIKSGLKQKAELLFFKALKNIKILTHAQPLKIFYRAIKNIQPVIETRTVLRSGKSYFVPKELTLKRQTMLAIKWLILAAYKSKDKFHKFSNSLTYEIINAANNTGFAVERAREVHERAFANRIHMNFLRKRKKRR